MLVFRTDASVTTGFGHLKRSTYLASLLKNKTEILFCVNNDKVVARFLEDRRTPFCLLKELNNLEHKKPGEIKSIVFDLREFSPVDIELLNRAKKLGIRTVQVTDLGLSKQPVDYTIDSSLTPLFPYAPLSENDNHFLLGPAYTILHHKFRHFNKVKRKYRQKAKNIFVSLGGAVQYHHLKELIDLLNRHQFNIKTASGFYLKKAARKTLKRLYPRLKLVGKVESLARPLFEADVAIVTAGVAAAEAAAVGTPALYFHYHTEQQAIAQSFQQQGAGLSISGIDDISKSGLIEVIRSLTLEKRVEMGSKAKQLVDGLGATRIVKFFEMEGII
jgi:spore coat polysaccharide biosynthesis predicted glycosyltransferase SpsG